VKNPPPANVLPSDAAKLLRQAAQTPLVPNAPEPDLPRRVAMEKATQQIKRKYPQFFKE
jgi:hypothetical protein